jgi:hypothetical protein
VTHLRRPRDDFIVLSSQILEGIRCGQQTDVRLEAAEKSDLAAFAILHLIHYNERVPSRDPAGDVWTLKQEPSR